LFFRLPLFFFGCFPSSQLPPGHQGIKSRQDEVRQSRFYPV
jgi:hypothetical protein